LNQVTINRRDMLLVAGSVIAAGATTAMTAAAQTSAGPKSETDIPSSTDTANEPYESASRGRRVS
jgi:hypothetical protein